MALANHPETAGIGTPDTQIEQASAVTIPEDQQATEGHITEPYPAALDMLDTTEEPVTARRRGGAVIGALALAAGILTPRSGGSMWDGRDGLLG